jgi:dUTP pyrophosphatase
VRISNNNRNKYEEVLQMNVKIKRLKDVPLPQYAKSGDAGFDLVAAEDVIIEPGQTVIVPTGLAFELPSGYEMQIRPRSGISAKTKLRVVLGTVDAGYRGEVGVIVDNIKRYYEIPGARKARTIDNERVDVDIVCAAASYVIRKGDRIAQAVIKPVEQAQFIEVDELSESARGEGGFGSTGTKSFRTETRKLSNYHEEITVYTDEEAE